MKNNDEIGLTQKQVAQDFDDVATNYQREINNALAVTGMEHSFFVDVKRDHILRLATAHFAELTELDVLDLGCGVGVYHPELKGHFRELHGLDISEQSIRIASAKHPWVCYETYDGIQLPYKSGQFSIVFAVCVMHHVPPEQWELVLTELYRVMKPNGLLLIFEHNPYNPVTQYIVKNCDIDKDAVLLTPRKLKMLAMRAGFEHVRTRTIISVPPSNSLLKLIDLAFGNLPFGAQYYLTGVKDPV